MSKPKAFLKQSKSKKQTRELSPETADDYLAAGVNLEEAGEKWRAGDAPKSMRFFVKAIDTYDEGLNRFPSSVDLAYNKARLQYEVATHPRLVSQLQLPSFSALLSALESHRYALCLDQDNIDALFNTGELLTEIAERIAEDDQQSDSDALPLLEEALELLDRCLLLQESQFTRFQASLDTNVSDSPPDSVSRNLEHLGSAGVPKEVTEEEQWALVVEPVTEDTLVDTVLAQIGTFTTLCSVLAGEEGIDQKATLRWIEQSSAKLFTTRLPTYKNNSDRRNEIALRIAQFKSVFLEASFHNDAIDIKSYISELEAAFADTDLDQESYLVSTTRADCLMTFISTTVESSYQKFSTVAPAVWSTLSATIANLIKASKSPGLAPDEIADTHSKRGDLSLLQYQLGKPSVGFTVASQNAAVSLKNARIYYRNASNLTHDELRRRNDVWKQLVVALLQQDDISSLISSGEIQTDFMNELVTSMVEGGLLHDQDVELIQRRFAFNKC